MNAEESRFGPPSMPIDIAKFIQEAIDIEAQSYSVFQAQEPSDEFLQSIAPENLAELAAECSVLEISNTLSDVWNRPRLSAHLLKSHEVIVANTYGTLDKNRKRKRTFGDPAEEPPEVTAFQNQLDAIQLSSWKLQADSGPFMRPIKNTDQNSLGEIKSSGVSAASARDAIIVASIYNRISWAHGRSLSRNSQHALLSSQTLGDLFRAFPCISNELPEEIVQDDRVTGYKARSQRDPGGCVILIEGAAYGDGQSEVDYADKLIAQTHSLPPDKRPHIKKAPTSMHDTQLSSLVVRIDEPYWLLHQGNCEHFVVIDQIRLKHPSDPPSGYPLTLQITPPLLDLCRACSKVPAVWSIIGDIRLGESPCVMCAPCWRHMGVPVDDGVTVVPLPKHESGW